MDYIQNSREGETRLLPAGCLAALGSNAHLVNLDRRPYAEDRTVSSFRRPYVTFTELIMRILALDGLSLFADCLFLSPVDFSLTSNDAAVLPCSIDSYGGGGNSLWACSPSRRDFSAIWTELLWNSNVVLEGYCLN